MLFFFHTRGVGLVSFEKYGKFHTFFLKASLREGFKKKKKIWNFPEPTHLCNCENIVHHFWGGVGGSENYHLFFKPFLKWRRRSLRRLRLTSGSEGNFVRKFGQL